MTDRMRDKNHMTVSIDAEKASDKIQYPFMVKKIIIIIHTQQIRKRKKLPQHKKGYIQKVQNYILNNKKRQAFPLR